MKENRRSLLQTKILVQLNEKSAKTLSTLAEQVSAQRPSVSRSVHRLKEQGLVFRDRQGWHLSEKGKAEAAKDQEKLAETTEIIRQATVRSSETLNQLYSSVGSTLQSLYPVGASMKNLVSPELFSIPASYLDTMKKASEMLNTPVLQLTTSMDYVTQLSEAMGKARVFDNLFLSQEFYAKALAPFFEMQERTSELLQQALAPQISQMSILAEAVLNQNNLVLADTINNLLAVRNSAFAQVVFKDYSWLTADISQVTQALAKVYNTRTQNFETSRLSFTPFQAADRFVVPSATVAYYTASAREYIAADIDPQPSALPNPGYEEQGDQNLDERLYLLNPDYVEMRHGSWSALSRPGPDRLRHAATSQRELLRQLLTQLVPDAQLPEENRGGPQLKARVRQALDASDSDAEYVVALSESVVRLYSQLNKYTHHNEKHEESLRALLHTGEGLMRFLLSLLDK